MTSISAGINVPAAPVKKVSLPRFRRVSTSEEVALMRERLIIARVMNGFSVEQAEERFGERCLYLGMIESGKKPFPRSHKFLSLAAQAYSVSLDFLFGLSPNMEVDPIFSQRYTLMRGFAAILEQQAKTTTAAFFNYVTAQDKLCKTQYQELSDSVYGIQSAIEVMRKHGFDELRGGATVLAILEDLEKAIFPVRKALAAQHEVEEYCKNMSLGKIGPISYLTDEYWSQENQLA
jgi:transcriptional regulator with XRE-family HTH domain